MTKIQSASWQHRERQRPVFVQRLTLSLDIGMMGYDRKRSRPHLWTLCFRTSLSSLTGYEKNGLNSTDILRFSLWDKQTNTDKLLRPEHRHHAGIGTQRKKPVQNVWNILGGKENRVLFDPRTFSVWFRKDFFSVRKEKILMRADICVQVCLICFMIPLVN